MPRKTSSPRLLLTRPEPSASETAAILRAAGYEVIVAPALLATPLPPRDLRLPPDANLIVTSPQAARYLKDWIALHALPVWAVGSHTAALLRGSGFTDVKYEDSEDSHSLLAQLTLLPKSTFYILGAPTTGRSLQASLRQVGHTVCREDVYQIKAAAALPADALIALAAGSITHILFYSARTAQSFLKLASSVDFEAIEAICISRMVAAQVAHTGFKAIKIAARPTAEALQALLPALESKND